MLFSDPAPSGRKIPSLCRASGALFPSTKRPRADARGYLLAEGKAVAVGHCLPVVAEGLIPLIYRRAFFKHPATPIVIALEEGPNYEAPEVDIEEFGQDMRRLEADSGAGRTGDSRVHPQPRKG